MSAASLAEVHLTKLAAARRQLFSAIRMFFAGEDELAIHTVASAAYSVICDLKSQRGRDEVGDYHLTTWFYAVRGYRRGTLPSYLIDDPETIKYIRELAEQLPITASSKYEDFNVSVSPDIEQEFWVKRNKVSNFLKHANRDASAHISMEEVDNLFLLMLAQGSYLDLTGDDLTAEGFVLWIYHAVDTGTNEGLPTELLKSATVLEHLPRHERMKFCSHLLNKLKEEWGET